MEDRLRLGQFVTERRGAHYEEAWVDGYVFLEINKKLQLINSERDEISRASQTLRKRKPTAVGPTTTRKSQQQQNSAIGVVQFNSNSNSNDGFIKPDMPKE